MKVCVYPNGGNEMIVFFLSLFFNTMSAKETIRFQG